MPTATANGKTFNFADGTTPEQMGEAIDFHFSTQPEAPRETTEPRSTSVLPDAVVDSGAFKVASEFVSGANRGLTETADFFTAGPINTVSNLVGSDFRVPTFTDTAQSVGIGQEGFMEPGIAQQVVSTAGEFAPAVAGIASQAAGIPSAVERVFANGIKSLENGSPQAKAIAERLNNPGKLLDTVAGIKRGDVAQAGKRLDDAGRVVTDKALGKAETQGFDAGVLSSLRAGSVQDKAKLKRILKLRESALQNARSGMLDRSSDVVGSSIKQRLDTIVRVNKSAGKRIGVEAKALKGKRLDFSTAIDDFSAKLDEARVSVGDEGLEFSGSRFEDLSQSERLLKVINKRVDRLRGTQDAADAHELKRFIDEQVTYGKSQGLSGEAESVVKGLRRDIDGILDESFDGYRQANEDYSGTIQVIDDLQSAAGKKIDISGRNAEKSLGTLARTVMSNNRGRIEIINTLDDLQTVATKHGGKFDDDILLQALFVDELDTVFKPSARTSLAGDVAKSAVDVGADVASGGATGGVLRAGAKFVGDKALGRNQENAIKAIREFLEQ